MSTTLFLRMPVWLSTTPQSSISVLRNIQIPYNVYVKEIRILHFVWIYIIKMSQNIK